MSLEADVLGTLRLLKDFVFIIFRILGCETETTLFAKEGFSAVKYEWVVLCVDCRGKSTEQTRFQIVNVLGEMKSLQR